MKVYKVVSVEDGKRVSAHVFRVNSLRVVYPVGKPTTTRVGKLFAFNTLKNARKFRVGIGNEIWKAEATGVTRMRRHLWTTVSTDITRILDEFWAKGARLTNKIRDRFGLESMARNPGTVLCDSITLMRRVK